MKRLTLGIAVAAMLFLGLQTVANATPSATPNIPNACKGKVPYDHYDYVVNGTSGDDVLIIASLGPKVTFFVNGMGGNDVIIMKGFSGPNCLWGGTGDDKILGSPSLLDTCVTGGNANDVAGICKTIVN